MPLNRNNLTKPEFLTGKPKEIRQQFKELSLLEFKLLDFKPSDVRPVILDAIRDELTTDPEGLGYAGKTPAEIAGLINTPQEKTTTEQVFESAPMARITKEVLAAGEFVLSENLIVDGKGKTNVKNLGLETAIQKAVDKEIETDAQYKGKSKEEIATILRTGKSITVSKSVTLPPRINQILIGIPLAPNEVSATDIEEALK